MIFLQGQELTRDITLPKIIETRQWKYSAFQQKRKQGYQMIVNKYKEHITEI